ncbi:hypothetical protein A2755_02875 [Candidatus Wolfebacteria bacterium RIFCSPHIGHO2_01_FULL_48_22]|uniref:Uncharacterized protein n=2 Tax=Candidatus Wolfeibacteriota TaxID=1752735 RepID=A0A1F8DRR0_9BACT|nr:MAG: hypothetical protein A2755_02875 [Candidatus Wolfebacteria bacterium RIFCSPHIGHO2_01_FULL_48_22]OGM92190.1 MAG: hypothetical protein A2935_00190 [Candidatus Wolfebacteria bacterium RIFCSPLOWO2_01_FULL_47_17b]
MKVLSVSQAIDHLLDLFDEGTTEFTFYSLEGKKKVSFLLSGPSKVRRKKFMDVDEIVKKSFAVRYGKQDNAEDFCYIEENYTSKIHGFFVKSLYAFNDFSKIPNALYVDTVKHIEIIESIQLLIEKEMETRMKKGKKEVDV